MLLKITNLRNPIVEIAAEANIPQDGILFHVSFEPNPRIEIARQAEIIHYLPAESGSFMFTMQDGKAYNFSILSELETWYILVALVAVEYYLAETISYRPQLVKCIIGKLATALR